MLFILTGDVQIGKTRWLERTISALEGARVGCAGVIAPGVWEDHGEQTGEDRFEKLGINNVLLPERTCVAFGRRRDLAQREGSFNPASQSAQAKMGWEISDAAIAQVNSHFANLAKEARQQEAALADDTADPFARDDEPAARSSVGASAGAPAPRLLVVDELGQLELLRNGGLTCAVDLLEQGPTPAFPHALAVIRQWLLDAARERFEAVWGPLAIIGPTEEAQRQLFQAFGR